MSDISKNIRKLRVTKGMSQTQLAEKLHITRQTVSSWETGNSNPDVGMLMKIAEALEVEVDAILYPEGRRKRIGRRIESIPGKFIPLSVFFFFVLFVWGGMLIGIPLFKALVGGGTDQEYMYLLYWGLVLLVGYIACCTVLLSEYLAGTDDPPQQT